MDAVLTRISSWLAGIACLALVFTMVITFVDVVGRFFLNAPLTFAVELVQLGMGILILFGVAMTTLKRGHISVDLVEGLMPKSGRAVLAKISALSGFVFIGLMAWRLWDRGIGFMNDGLATQVLFLPIYPVVLFMASAAAVAALIAGMQIFKQANTQQDE